MSRLAALFFVVTLTFLMMKSLPGDPFNQEQALPAEIHEALRNHYGLNDPWHMQYLGYLKKVATWDLGPSFRYHNRTVNEIIQTGFPVSALLGAEALFFAVSVGITTGVASALYYSKWQDKLILVLASLALSIPSFILGALLQYIFSLKLGLLPIARWGDFAHSILPAISLGALPAAFIARMTRNNLIEAMNQGYVRAARARGLSETRIISLHALRNAIIPVISYLGPLTANVLVGSFVIEKIFAIPGLGQWFVNSVLNRDYTVIMGLTVFYSVILMSTVFIVDLAYAWLDPRISASNP